MATRTTQCRPTFNVISTFERNSKFILIYFANSSTRNRPKERNWKKRTKEKQGCVEREWRSERDWAENGGIKRRR